jgi:hypothetical protein
MAVTPLPPPITVEPESVEPGGTEVTASQPAPTASGGYDDDEEFVPPRRRDLDDDDFDVRRAGGQQAINSMAMTSMVMGIVAVFMGTAGCLCCGVFGAAAGAACGVMAVIFGFMGQAPGSETYSLVGIISGGVAIVLGLIGVAVVVFALGINLGLGNFK